MTCNGEVGSGEAVKDRRATATLDLARRLKIGMDG